ncbi:MAG: sulfite exporter TauE/SafE family protein [candidate division WOR-3 bacterium]
MNEILVFLMIGILAGVFSGLFGIGGGVIMVLGLTLIGFSQQKAQGTSLGALIIPIGILPGFLEYLRNGNLDLKVSLIMIIGLAIGSFFGAYIANKLPSLWLSRLFGVLLIFLAIRMIFKT